MKLKVCGMKYPENIEQVAALQPDYLGFIFYEGSPRNFDTTIPEIPSAIKKTGVFVDATLEFVLEKVRKYNFKAVQLHGDESAEYCRQLKQNFPDADIEIIKVFSVKEHFDFDRLKEYEGKVDYFLFDTKGKNKGGNGYAFDWEILKNYPSPTPFFLSGGIGPEDLTKIEEFRLHLEDSGKGKLFYAVDVNSKFESEPGLKDVKGVGNFRNNFKIKD